MNQPSLFDYKRPDRSWLARSSDPVTSHAAAAAVSHELSEDHQAVLEWLLANSPATDDQMAWAMVEAGRTRRPEQARRWVRTLRERKNLICPALDDGQQITLVNETGRMALAWEAVR